MNDNEILSGPDIMLGLVCGFLVLIVGLVVWARSPVRKLLVGALVAKLLSCYVLSLLTIPVFGGGDMIGYHDHGIIYAKLLGESLMTGSTNYFNTTPFYLLQFTNTERCRSFSGLVHLFTFNSFIASSVVFAVIGFLGQYNLYRTFASAYPSPRVRAWWVAGILYMPSLTFWSAGLLKDPLGLWGLGCAVWGAFSFFKWNQYFGILRMVVGTYVMLLFRAQAAPVTMLAMAPLLFATKPTPGAIKVSKAVGMARAVLRLGCLFAFIAVFAHSNSVDRRVDYSNIQQSLLNERNNYTKVGGGSTVTDQIETPPGVSAFGLLRLWPESVIFCLFRPFLWESLRSPLMLVAGVENTVLLALTLRAAFFAVAKPRALAASLQESLFLSCLIFVGLFAFALGVATPNLGTISRYRLPVIPFFIGTMAILDCHRLEVKPRPMPPNPLPPLTYPRSKPGGRTCP